MKLFTCVVLVLVILEEYHCEPCLHWPCEGRRQDNDSENKLSAGLGFTAKTMISGQSENGHRPRYNPHQRFPPYSQNGLGHTPMYQLHQMYAIRPNGLGHTPRDQPDFQYHGYPSYSKTGLGHRPSYKSYYRHSRQPSYPYFTYNGRSLGATYNIQHGRKVGASNGTPQRTPFRRGWYGPLYNSPRFGITPLVTAHQTPIGAPNDSPNSPPNGTTAQTPVETGDGTPQRKLFFVTPNGIRETPAEPSDNAS